MKYLMKLDHIGYAVSDIKKTASHYVDAGWELSEEYDEVAQNARIAFLTKQGFPTIELVAPGFGEKDPVSALLKKSGVSPYHMCYEVDDILQAMEALYEEGFVPLFMPVESVAMHGRQICYLTSLDVGTIEIVSKE